MKYLLKNAHLIIDGSKEYLDGSLLINDERIEDVFVHSNKVDGIDKEYQTIDLNGCIVMPGFFDTHCHGIKGINYDNASINEFDEASLYLAQSGTTSFIPSLSYDLNKEDCKKQLTLLNAYESKYARYMGTHLEGPFLSKLHTGAGNGKNLLDVDIEYTKELLSINNNIKQMTIAIELENSGELIQLLKDNNIKVMVGHSDACQSDLNNQVDGFTHLFNAMNGLNHHKESLINAAFTNKYYCEIIGDGIHLNEGVLRLIINNIDKNRIILISDSSTAQGLDDGVYEFLSSKCVKKGNSFINERGSLAGSVSSINDEMKVLRKLGVDYTNLLLYSSLNAYRFYNIDNQYGSLTKGKHSDIVIMDNDLNIKNVLVRGNLLYENVLY